MSNDRIWLQRFLVPTGWKVDWHQFYEVDPTPETMHYFDSPTLLMIYHQHANLLLDMSWKPEGDQEGEFILKLIPCIEVYNPHTKRLDGEGLWEAPIDEFRTRNRLKLVEKIENWLECSKGYEDPRILKSPGEVDEPSESLRLRMLEEGLTMEIYESILSKGNRILQLMLINHNDIAPSMLQTMMEKAVKKGLRKRATDIFNSKRFRLKHGLD